MSYHTIIGAGLSGLFIARVVEKKSGKNIISIIY